ncbi:NlpC/P60 family protein [Paenibacillus hamazuiensis]|uniref:C40 family peptidase n=1 Tax=Paenibacillus hamazuiensis TaxID=2936508 RepID=UPI00200C25F0|nr:NlpC/P60 family protein [Paenibacillus hamazuiensis]
MKKRITIILVAAASAALITTASAATGLVSFETVAAPFHWKVGDKTYSSQDGYSDGTTTLPSSLNYNGTTYIPIRLLAETLGFKVDWDGSTNTATIVPPDNEDDPISDLPGPFANKSTILDLAPEVSVLSAASIRTSPADSQGGTSIPAGTKLKVLGEDGKLIKVQNNGAEGYVDMAATDYVAEADRPSWEQKADAIIRLGGTFLGTPYQFGAAAGQTNTFDCSSFVGYIFGKQGIKLPRDSRQQSQKGTPVDLAELRKGDLIFFTTPQRKNKTGIDHIGHVAVYAGNNKLLHTFRVGIGVTVTELDKNWKSRIVSAKRVIN